MKKPLGKLAVASALGAMLPGGLQAAPDERPNFVWFMAEDVAKHFLSLYNEHGAATPHVEALAQNGVVFNQGPIAMRPSVQRPAPP